MDDPRLELPRRWTRTRPERDVSSKPLAHRQLSTPGRSDEPMGHVKSASQLLAEMKTIWERADQSGRDLTTEERRDVEGLLVEIKHQKNIEGIGRELGAGMEFVGGNGSNGSPFGQFAHYQTPGEAFVASRATRRSGARCSRPVVDVGRHRRRAGHEGHAAGGRRLPGLRYRRRSGDRPAGRPGRRGEPVPAAHVRRSAPVGAGVGEHAPVRGGRYRDVRCGGCG